MSNTRVVITGLGQISPLGIGWEALWESLREGRSGVRPLERLPQGDLPTRFGGEAAEFTGDIGDFGPLEKPIQRSIKKGLKLMCREIEMGVAAAQWAMHHAGIQTGSFDPDRIGCVFGCDYIMTEPDEFSDAIRRCTENGAVDFSRWGQEGLPQVEPLWLLKYLPNMPASHVAIYNDLRGPSNSLTVRESSANLAVAESMTTIQRGLADIIVCGSTGSRVHPLRLVHTMMQEPMADLQFEPARACRPFDRQRTGMVIGEGAGAVILENLESAEQRGAKIWGEILGCASSTVANRAGEPDQLTAFSNVIEIALQRSGLAPDDIGHVHAHGLSTKLCDAAEAQAIVRSLGTDRIPVTATKSYTGNLGAGSGLVELIASVLALQEGWLFPIINYETPDPDCPVRPAEAGMDPGTVFINLNTTPQGQASAVVVRRWTD